MIQIRKIDIDSLGGDKNEPPSWAKVDAIVNGVGVKFTLTEAHTERLLDTARPIIEELLVDLREPGSVVLEMRKPA